MLMAVPTIPFHSAAHHEKVLHLLVPAGGQKHRDHGLRTFELCLIIAQAALLLGQWPG